MREKLTLGLAFLGLGLYVSIALFGLTYMLADITGRAFHPWAALFAIGIFWIAIGFSEFGSWIYRKYKNPRKQ